MKKLFIFILLLTFGVQLLSAQSDVQSPGFILKTNILSLVDVFAFPTIDLTAEKKIGEKFSIAPTFGIELYNFNTTDTAIIPNKGYKFNLEGRYYFRNAFDGFYTGAHFFVRQDQYTALFSYQQQPFDITYIEEKAIGVERKCVGANFILGFEKIFNGKVCLDAFVGIGGMDRKIRNTNRDYSKDDLLFLNGRFLIPRFFLNNRSESSGGSINFTSGFRLGIAF